MTGAPTVAADINFYSVPVSFVSGAIPSNGQALSVIFHPAGARGQTGPTGPSGPTGPTGPAGPPLTVTPDPASSTRAIIGGVSV